MKTYRIVSMLVACLLVATTVLSSEEEDAVVQKYCIEFQNPEKLKSQLVSMFSSTDGVDRQGIERLKQRFDISDEIMRRVAMEVYEESLVAVKEKRTDGIDGGLNTYRQQLAGALFCLGLSANQTTKQMLMAIARDDKEEMALRQKTISAYLRAADAEEAKNVLLLFLAEENRMEYMDRLSLYEYARMAYDQADENKRAAILSVLYIALSRSDLTPWEFRDCDDILVKLSPEYSKSNERFALLQKHNAASYPKLRERTKNEVKERLEIMRKLKNFTNINTNLAALKTRDFNLPLPVSATNEVTETTSESTDTKAGVENKQANKTNSTGVLSLIGGVAILILGLGFWHFARRR